MIGDALRSRTHRHQVTEATIAVNALNRMLEFGRLVRPYRVKADWEWHQCVHPGDPCNKPVGRCCRFLKIEKAILAGYDRARPWRLAQSRLRQELEAMRISPQSAHRSTWPPSAGVRHVSMAPMTRRRRWTGWQRVQRAQLHSGATRLQPGQVIATDWYEAIAPPGASPRRDESVLNFAGIGNPVCNQQLSQHTRLLRIEVKRDREP